MLDVSRLIVATLRGDAQYKALAGGPVADPRVYPYYQGNAVLDPTVGKNAYITYAETADPEKVSAVQAPVYTLAIWAVSDTTAEAVQERVLSLLDYSSRPDDTLTAPTSGRRYHPTKLGSHWSSQENTKFFGITLQIRFGASAV